MKLTDIYCMTMAIDDTRNDHVHFFHYTLIMLTRHFNFFTIVYQEIYSILHGLEFCVLVEGPSAMNTYQNSIIEVALTKLKTV